MTKFNLQNSNIKIVERKKIWFTIPAIILALALIVGIVVGFTTGNPFNMSMDFVDGYSVTVTFGAKLNNDNQSEKEKEINDFFDNFVTADGKSYDLKVDSITRQGADGDAALYIRYKAGKDVTAAQMIDVNEELTISLKEAFFADDVHGGKVSDADSVSAAVHPELLIRIVSAVTLSVALILVYLAIRFGLQGSFASLLSLLMDLLVVTAFMIIFHIPMTATFIAALITVLAFSIFNSSLVFNKIKEQLRNSDFDNRSYAYIANDSVNKTLTRTLVIAAISVLSVSLIMILAAAFITASIIFFCLPLIIGIISSAFTSSFIAPSIWTILINRHPRTQNSSIKVKHVAKEAVAVAPAPKLNELPEEESATDGTETILSDSTEE